MRLFSLLLLTSLVLPPAWPVNGLWADNAPLSVFVSIPPQAEFVKRVGGERVKVEILLGQGQSPHTFDPSPRALARLGESRLFFRIGVPYEQRIAGKLASAFGNLEVVDTRQGINLRQVEGEQHGHEGDDPHIWLDPRLAQTQATTICEALIKADPGGKPVYRANLSTFRSALDSLDAELKKVLAPYRGRAVYVYHPAFGYFTDAYGLRQSPVQIGGHEPSARELAALVEKMRAGSVRTLFVQPEFPSPVAEALQQALGCRVVRLNPLAENYLDNLREMGRLVAAALEGEK